MEKDIRWIQRFSNYRKALSKLTEAVDLSKERTLSDLEQQGLIQAFEYTYELAWNTLQDILFREKISDKGPGPNVVLSKALAEGFIQDKEQWEEMKQARIRTTHYYDEEQADAIAKIIISRFHGMFIQLETRLQLEKLNREK